VGIGVTIVKEHSPQTVQQNKEHFATYLAGKSHEFRNALACISAFGDILVDGLAVELSDEQRQYVGIMLKNASAIRRALDRALEETSDMPERATSKIHRFARADG
jgi:signal transduction histidine kinase